MLSPLGWLNGISVSGIVLFNLFLGLFMIYQSKKYHSRVLLYSGCSTICAGLLWLGNFVDFISILITGQNIDNTHGLYGLLSFVWLGPSALLVLGVYLEMFKPRIGRLLFVFYLVLGILYEILLFLNIMNSFEFIYPLTPGEDLIDEQIIISTPIYFMMLIFGISALTFWLIGFLIRGIQAKGVIRKKYLVIAFAGLIFTINGFLDVSVPPGPFLSIIRFSNIIVWILFYLGIRVEPEKRKKEPPKKEIKIEGGLFRISKRPDQITEEEVSLYKEKKICLVCKGSATGFNIFVCPNCDTLYCQKCATALSNLENACWACNRPIDESKPSKPFNQEKEDIKPTIKKDYISDLDNSSQTK